MKKKDEVAYVGLDVSKAQIAAAIADMPHGGDAHSLGTIPNTPSAVDKLLTRLSKRAASVEICYEAGPTGYGLYRQVTAAGLSCSVVAPSLIPMRAGDRVKTDRLDAMRLARLLRAGELTPIWDPDETHEAMRDLVRARESVAEDQRHKRQLISAFLLRHGRDLLPGIRAIAGWDFPPLNGRRRMSHEAQPVRRRADHCRHQGE